MTAALLDLFAPGKTIYLPGASGEIRALASALGADPDRMRGVEVVGCFLPGMNHFDYAALDASGRVTTFLLAPPMRPSFEAGRARVIPIAYSAIARHLASRAPFDVAVAHVALPDERGRCSLGIASDFTTIAWANALRRVLWVNPLMPAMKRGPSIALSEADEVIHCESALVETDTGEPGAEARAVAAHAATLVPDGATIQVGIGGAPGAIWTALTGHQRLTIASGMIADGAALLDRKGALRSGGQHQTGVALGSGAFYQWLSESNRVGFATTSETHDVRRLAAMERFTALNSALEVDLFGQVNLEWQGGRLSSGVGGAPDFARAAALSDGGRSIVMLPSTAGKGAISRIVSRLDTPTASIARTDIDTVVTEHGIATLRGLDQEQRAAALIRIAAPEWRERLEIEWLNIWRGR